MSFDDKLLKDLNKIPREFLQDIITAYKQIKKEKDSIENRYYITGMVAELYKNYFRIQKLIVNKDINLKEKIEKLEPDAFIKIVNEEIFKLGYNSIVESNIDLIVAKVVKVFQDEQLDLSAKLYN